MLNDLYTVNLLTACSNLFENNNLAAFSDIKILLENGEELHGHKLILFSQSEIWNQDELEKVDILDLSDICQTTSYCLIRWLYTNTIPIDIDCQTLFQLLQQSISFKIPALQNICEKMLTSLVNEENCEIFYNTAVDISDTVLMEYCQKYFSQNTDITQTNIGDNHEVMSEDEPISIDVAQIIVLDTVETDTDPSVKLANQQQEQSGDGRNTSQGGQHLSENKPYECDYCEKSFSKSQYLLDHIKIVHSTSKPFSCPHCCKTFTVNKSLKRHLNAHCTKTLHTCDICSKSFNQKRGLENHSKIHTLEPERLKSSLSIIRQEKEISMSVFKDKGTGNSQIVMGGEGTSYARCLDVTVNANTNTSDLRVKGEIDSDLSQSTEDCTKLDSEMDITLENTVSDSLVESKARKLTAFITNLPDSRKRPYKCDVCNKSFTKTNHLKDHRTVHTKVREFICEMCASSFLTKNSLRQHLRTHSSEKPYKCDVCSKSFVQNRDLQNHIQKNADCHRFNEDVKNCINDENEVLISEDGIKAGRETIKDKDNQDLNSGSNLCRCRICQREFINQTGLRVHMKTHTSSKLSSNHQQYIPDHEESKDNICHVCSKSFNSNHALVIHVRTHTGEKPFQCDVCPKAFRSASVLSGHKRTHIGIKPYKCGVCNKRFSKTNHVREHHQNIHSTDRPYSCEICHKSFPTDRSLKVHVRTHNRVENAELYKCDICDKSFNQKSTLQKHLKHHVGNKDVMCDVCGKSFYDTSDLNRHARIHINEPHCDICSKTFCNQEYLQKHMMAHEGVKQYACEKCDKSYFTNYNLNRHLKVCNKSKLMSE